jgi:hypothetical protein
MDIVENDQSQGLPELTKSLTSGACGAHDQSDRRIKDNWPAAAAGPTTSMMTTAAMTGWQSSRSRSTSSRSRSSSGSPSGSGEVTAMQWRCPTGPASPRDHCAADRWELKAITSPIAVLASGVDHLPAVQARSVAGFALRSAALRSALIVSPIRSRSCRSRPEPRERGPLNGRPSPEFRQESGPSEP